MKTKEEIRNAAKTARNKIIANSSTISGDVKDPEIIQGLKDIVYHNWRNFLGEIPTTAVGEFKAIEIKNLTDTYYMAEGYLEMDRKVLSFDPRIKTPSEAHSKVHAFAVKHNDSIETFNILENTVTDQNDVYVPKKELKFKHSTFELNPKTDINDLNSIRYQMRNNPEVAHFMDKFLIVSPKARMSYLKYKKEQDLRRTKILAKKAIHGACLPSPRAARG